ncbi:hypothetical protein R1sor_010474 [Riccia sorocarpa]|uniref:Uncharacterized protein n=1 Tax=Riccia sorocarpa TaxID=122646 RepID=A0ABD3I0W7_9MARC
MEGLKEKRSGETLRGSCAKLRESYPPTTIKLSQQLEEICGLVVELSKEVVAVKVSLVELRMENLRLHEKVQEQVGKLGLKHNDLLAAQCEVHEVRRDLAKYNSRVEGQVEGFSLQVSNLQEQLGKAVVPIQIQIQKEALVEMETRIRSYAYVARDSQAALLQAHEKERTVRLARSLNIHVVGLDEVESENTQEEVTRFFQDELRVISPKFDYAARVGRRESIPQVILVRFPTADERNRVLNNRSLLKGRKLWLDSDLTPLQAEERKKEVQKVREATQAGWIAFMREDKAVITTKKREESK